MFLMRGESARESIEIPADLFYVLLLVISATWVHDLSDRPTQSDLAYRMSRVEFRYTPRALR